MNLQYTSVTPLAYFESLVDSDLHFPLLEAAASLAQDEEPGLDVQQVLADCDNLLARLQRRFKSGAEPIAKLSILNQFFYTELGFCVNANNYYAFENSLLSEVLRTRRGIPISLAVIWLELAQAAGLDAQGVSFPGHFLVKITLPEGLVVLDPLTGESLGLDTLSERLAPFRSHLGEHGDSETPLGLFLQACPPRDVLARMLRNLKEIFSSQSDGPRLLAISERLVRLLPQAHTERRDRGLTLIGLGQIERARQDLQHYLHAVPHAADAQDIGHRLAALNT